MAMLGAIRTELQSSEVREARRHSLSLNAQASTGAGCASVTILNLSSTGLLIEAGVALGVGDRIDVQLPQAGTARAEVVWRSGEFFGCEFDEVLSAATMSAARLLSPFPASEARVAPAVLPDETPVAAEPDPGKYSPRQKTVIIAGLAMVSWAPISLAAWLLF